MTGSYRIERAFVAIVIVLGITGFWTVFVGAEARPTPYHYLHAIVNFTWLALLFWQLNLVGNKHFSAHRTIGLSILVMGPLLVASTALLSVYSAYKGVVSGQGDVLIVQNVMVTLELALLILLAFILRKRRRLHGAFLLGTAIQFMGIALVFTLVSFVPPFKIEGPDTFYRFGTAGAASQFVCLAAGLFFFIRDPRHGWPVFLAGLLLAFNTGLDWFLGKQHLLEPLTAFVGSINQTLSFTGSFAVLVAALAATGIETWPAAKYRKGLAGS